MGNDFSADSSPGVNALNVYCQIIQDAEEQRKREDEEYERIHGQPRKRRYNAELAARCELMIQDQANRTRVAEYFDKHDGMCEWDASVMQGIIERLGEQKFVTHIVDKDINWRISVLPHLVRDTLLPNTARATIFLSLDLPTASDTHAARRVG